MNLEKVNIPFDDVDVTFVLDEDQSDTYVDAIRRGYASKSIFNYVGRLSKIKCRPIKMIDAGANIGTISLPCSVVHGSEVLAIEALAKNQALLTAAAKENNLGSKLRPILLAAFENIGVLSVVGNSAWGGVRLTGSTPIASAPLITIMEQHGFLDADFIKVDIEGAELSAISGMEDLLNKDNAPDVIYESNNHTCNIFGYTTQDLRSWFLARGYNLYVIEGDNTLIPIDDLAGQWQMVSDILSTKTSKSELVDMGYQIIDVDHETMWRHISLTSKTVPGYNFITSQEPHLPTEITQSERWVELKALFQAFKPAT